MEKLRLYTKEQILDLTRIRAGEIKLGERIQTVSDLNSLALSTCKFVLLGIPEDIGVKANFGIGGASTAWKPALKAILNIQSTEKFRGDELAVLGHLDFEDEISQAQSLDPQKDADLQKLHSLVNKVDNWVEDVLKMIFGAGKIPVVVGGGHNNSYPILKAFSKSFARPVNTINLDAHSDFRPLEGRHSGNGFSYAFKEGFLGKYSVIGMHENYNSQAVVDKLKLHPKQIQYVFFDDIIRENTSHSQAFQEALNFTEGLCGLEIDLDSISGALTSAMSPSGFSVEQIRDMIFQTRIRQFFYLHIAEGAGKLDNGHEDLQTGKLIGYLISDFIKAQL
jgi:formiminoglutamase